MVYLKPPVEKNGDIDCDDDDGGDEEIIDPLNPDRLPWGIFLSPAEIGLRANKTPQIIGMRGKEIDDEREISPARGGTGRESTINDDSNVSNPSTNARYDNIGHLIKKYEIGHRDKCRKCTEDKHLGHNISLTTVQNEMCPFTLTASGNSIIYENKWNTPNI